MINIEIQIHHLGLASQRHRQIFPRLLIVIYRVITDGISVELYPSYLLVNYELN